MTVTTAADVPDGVPLVKVPISLKAIRAVAEDHDVDVVDFADALEAVDRHVAERARELTERTTRELGDDALVFQEDIQQHLYVESAVWAELQTALGLSDEMVRAIKSVHDRQCSLYEERLDRVDRVEDLERYDVLVMPTPIVQDLIEAGLSRRQAAVQALRSRGDSLERIHEKMGDSVTQIERLVGQIDRKIQQAEELLVLVDTPGFDGDVEG